MSDNPYSYESTRGGYRTPAKPPPRKLRFFMTPKERRAETDRWHDEFVADLTRLQCWFVLDDREMADLVFPVWLKKTGRVSNSEK